MDEKEVDTLLTNTPYDDVFRTLTNDCREFLLPLLNEVFGEHYLGQERIRFSVNEHFLNRQDGEENKRITDTSFLVEVNGVTKRYHLECQVTTGHSLIVRLFEYDAQIALDEDSIQSDNRLRVSFPNTAVLYLRSSESTADRMEIEIATPAGEISYQIPIIKMQSYTLGDIFRKNLLFLLPFYIFNREKELPWCDADENRRKKLLNELTYIRERLEELAVKKEITEFQKRAIIEMTAKVIANLSSKYRKVSREALGIMVGKTLDYEAKTILNQGIEQGIEQGIGIGIEQGNLKRLLSQVIKKVQKSKSISQIAEELESTEEELKPLYDIVLANAPDYNMENMLSSLEMKA